MELISLLLALSAFGLVDAAQPCSEKCPTGYGWISPPPYGGHAAAEESYQEGSCLTLQWKSPWPDVRIAYVSKESNDFVYIEQNETTGSQHWDVDVTECPSISDNYYMYFEDVENPDHHCWSNLWSVTPDQGGSSGMSSSSSMPIPYYRSSTSSSTLSGSPSGSPTSQTQNTPINSVTVPGSVSHHTSSTSHTSQSPPNSGAPPTSNSLPTSTRTTPPSPPPGPPVTSDSPPVSSTSSSPSSTTTSASATSGSSTTSTITSGTTSSSVSSSSQTSSTTSYTCTTIFQPLSVSTTTVTATVVTITTTAISTQTVIVSYLPSPSISTFPSCSCPTDIGCNSNGQNSTATLTITLPTITPTAAPANSTATTTPFPVTPDDTPSTSTKIGLSVGFGVGILAIGALAGCCFFCLRRKRRRDDDSDCEGINNGNVDVAAVNASGGGAAVVAGEATAAAEAAAIARGGYVGVYGEASKNQYGVVTEEKCGSRGSSIAHGHTEYDAGAGNGVEVETSIDARGGAATCTDMTSGPAIDAAEAAAAALIIAGLAGRRSSNDSHRSQRSCRSRGGSSEYSQRRWFPPRTGSGAAILTMSGAVEEFDAESGRYRFAEDEAVVLNSNGNISNADRRSEAEGVYRSASERGSSSVSRQYDQFSGGGMVRGLWCDCRTVDPFSDAGNTCRCGLDASDGSKSRRTSQNVDFFSTFEAPRAPQKIESSREVIYDREMRSSGFVDTSREEHVSCVVDSFHQTTVSRGVDMGHRFDAVRETEVTREIYTSGELDGFQGVAADQHTSSTDTDITRTKFQETERVFEVELGNADVMSSTVETIVDESEEIMIIRSAPCREGVTSMIETVTSEEEATVWVQSKVEGLPSNVVTREVGDYGI